MAYFIKFLHGKTSFSKIKFDSRSSYNSNLHAKIAQNWQIALSNYFCPFQLFATNYTKNSRTKIKKKEQNDIAVL